MYDRNIRFFQRKIHTYSFQSLKKQLPFNLKCRIGWVGQTRATKTCHCLNGTRNQFLRKLRLFLTGHIKVYEFNVDHRKMFSMPDWRGSYIQWMICSIFEPIRSVFSDILLFIVCPSDISSIKLCNVNFN